MEMAYPTKEMPKLSMEMAYPIKLILIQYVKEFFIKPVN